MSDPVVSASLDKTTAYGPTETMTLTVVYSDPDHSTGTISTVVTPDGGVPSDPVVTRYENDPLTVAVSDPDRAWTLVDNVGGVARYASPTSTAGGTVTATVTDSGGHTATCSAAYAFQPPVVATPPHAPAFGFQTTMTTWQQAQADVGLPVVRRTFENWPPDWDHCDAAQDTGAFPVEESIISFRPPMAEFLAGKQDDYARHLISTMPRSHRKRTTVYHEPEDQVYPDTGAPQFTLQNWKDAVARWDSLVKEANDPNHKTGVIMMGFAASAKGQAKFGSIDSWWDPRFANLDWWGWDVYMDLSGKGMGPSTLSGAVDALLAFIQRHEVKEGVMAEFAVNEILNSAGQPVVITAPSGNKGTDKSVLLESIWKYVNDNPIWRAVSYFDAKNGTHYAMDSTYAMRSSSYSTAKVKSIISRSRAGQ